MAKQTKVNNTILHAFSNLGKFDLERAKSNFM